MEASHLVQAKAALYEYYKVSRVRAVARQRNLTRKHERDLAVDVDAWRKRVAAEIIARKPRVPSDVDALPLKTFENLGLKSLNPLVAKIFRAGYKKLSLKKQEGDEEDIIEEAAKKYLKAKGARKIREIVAETANGIKAIIREAIERGFGPDKVGRFLRPNVGLTDRLALAVGRRYTELLGQGLEEELAWARMERYAQKLQTYRSKMIARTETGDALRHGTIEAYKERGVELLDRIGDPQCCEACAEANDDSPYTPDEAADLTTIHPNCVLPGNLIVPGGKILLTYKAFYRGAVVRIKTASGVQCAVTPNHYFLTPFGLRCASELHNGDYLLKTKITNGPIRFSPDDNWKPSPIEEIVHTLSISGCRRTRSVEPSTEYFHGDGAFLEGDIDIIRSDGPLLNRIKTGRSKHLDEFDLMDSYFLESGLPGDSDFVTMFRGLASAADTIMISDQSGRAFNRRHLLPHNMASLGMTAGGNPGSKQSPSDRGPAGIEILGKLLLRYAGCISPDQIIYIEKDSHAYAGHVYDLQTSTSLYTVSDLIVHNCECAFIIHVGAEA